MKNTVTILCLCITLLAKAQENGYAGIYSYGSSSEKRSGMIYLYPNTDSTYLFYLEISRGAPSYNSGAMVGEFKVSPGQASHYRDSDSTSTINCDLSLSFFGGSLKIVTSDNSNECGFGFGVYADATYIKSSNDIPQSFIDRLGRVTSFVDLDVENWRE